MLRRFALAAFAMAAVLAAAGTQAQERLPVLFVHGNGDSAALWHTTIWRFESNGYDPKLLAALDFPRPLARSEDDVPQENRSGTVEAAGDLAAAVTRMLIETRQKKVALVASSRGGNAIRNYVKNGGGAGTVAVAVLGGTPNHGVFMIPDRPKAEFNGAGFFLKGLNEGGEIVPGVKWVTLRSDRNDKFAQATGEWVGMPGKPTGITAEGPALEGAENIVLPGLDHREVAFHRLAFREIWRAVAGGEPRTLDIVAESQPVLDGIVSGWANKGPTNLPLAGAEVAVWEVDPASGERRGAEPAHRKTVGADGRWGPFTAKPDAYYEFVASAPDSPTTHVYRTPFPRGSRYIHLRLAPQDEKDKASGAAVTLIRPRGYLGQGRDTFLIDGAVPDGVPPGVPGVASATRRWDDATSRAVPVMLNDEKMTVRTWPSREGHVVLAEFHH